MIIRPAKIYDILDIFKWRNDLLSRNMFLDSSIVPINKHKKWFENSLVDQNTIMYIGVLNKNKIGITRFDLNKIHNYAIVSINLNPKMRGKNLSFKLLSSSVKIYLENKNNINLIAKVKKKNLKSLKIFKKTGFEKFKEEANCQYLIFKKRNLNIGKYKY